jgi:hypothetical protein
MSNEWERKITRLVSQAKSSGSTLADLSDTLCSNDIALYSMCAQMKQKAVDAIADAYDLDESDPVIVSNFKAFSQSRCGRNPCSAAVTAFMRKTPK